MIAVTTVRDEGAALVAKEALEARGIEVELKRLGVNPYFGSVTVDEIEVRVAEEHAGDARAILAQLEAETEQALLAQAGVPADEEDGPDALPPPEARPRKVSWAIVLPLVLFPGAGCMYARQFALGLILFGVLIGSFVLPVAGFHPEKDWYVVFLALKLLDMVLAPLFVVRFNRRLARQGNHHAHA